MFEANVLTVNHVAGGETPAAATQTFAVPMILWLSLPMSLSRTPISMVPYAPAGAVPSKMIGISFTLWTTDVSLAP
jgi:hypothetical protein